MPTDRALEKERARVKHIAETANRRRDIPLCRQFARGEGLVAAKGTQEPTCPKCLEIAVRLGWRVEVLPVEEQPEAERYGREKNQLQHQGMARLAL